MDADAPAALPPVLRVLIVDDEPTVRAMLRRRLENDGGFEVVGEAGDGATALPLVERALPHVVLMDVRMPGGMDGVRATSAISARRYRNVEVVMLSASDDEAVVAAALEAGAAGYLIKTANAAEIIEGIRAAAAGDAPMSAQVVRMLRDRVARDGSRATAARERLARLTERERQVVAEVATGARNREIAERLGLSEHTVHTYVRDVIRKVRAANRTELSVLWQAASSDPG